MRCVKTALSSTTKRQASLLKAFLKRPYILVISVYLTAAKLGGLIFYRLSKIQLLLQSHFSKEFVLICFSLNGFVISKEIVVSVGE